MAQPLGIPSACRGFSAVSVDEDVHIRHLHGKSPLSLVELLGVVHEEEGGGAVEVEVRIDETTADSAEAEGWRLGRGYGGEAGAERSTCKCG